MAYFTQYILIDIGLFILALFTIIYLWFRHRYTYWARRGVDCPPPIFPVGNIKELFDGTFHIGEQFEHLYYQTRNKPFVGLYLAHKYVLMVNDVELAKNVIVKDFMHFTDHGLVHHEESEPLEGHLFNINGNRWKTLRVKLIASFTSSKIKYMFETMVRHGLEVQKYLEPHIKAGNAVDLKELMSRYTTDVIGTSVFGIECKSIWTENSPFRMMSRKSQRLNTYRSAIQSMSLMAPWVVKFLKTSMYQIDVNEFFMKEAKKAVQFRKENGLSSNDYMQTLMKLRDTREMYEKQGKKIDAETEDDDSMSMGDIAAQFFVFFVDGAETSSTTASFALYELARNPDIQEKLRNEIDNVLDKYNGFLSFEAIMDMKYLAQIVDETLRMYPPLPLLMRVCTKTYNIPNTNVTIDKGTSVMIPMLGIHRDPDIYPNPMQFDPERFSAENKAERHKFSHLPFGEGPRMCMGNRFGALMARMGLISIVSQYVVTIDSKEIRPFSFEKNQFILAPIGGINLKLVKRNTSTEFKC